MEEEGRQKDEHSLNQRSDFFLSLSLSQLYLFFSLFRVLRSQKQLQEFGLRGLVGLGTGPERLNTLTVWNDLLPLKRKNKKEIILRKKEKKEKQKQKKAVLPPSVPIPYSCFLVLFPSSSSSFFFLSISFSFPTRVNQTKKKTNNHDNNLLEINPLPSQDNLNP